MKSALLVIEVQHDLLDQSPRPYEADKTIQRINAHTTQARAAGIPVFFIQYEQTAGLLEYGSDS